jgi:hypothetical protein
VSLSNFPCGYIHNEKCVLDIDLSCQTTCFKLNHYKSFNGICELKQCNERVVINEENEGFKCHAMKLI